MSLAVSLAGCSFFTGCQTVGTPVSGSPGQSGTPTWSIQYQGTIQVRNRTYHVVDLFDVSDADLARIRAAGSRPIAYFSSQYERWRPDSSRFPASDLGRPLAGWPGERWVNTRSSAVRSLIRSRLDLAKRRGFHGVDVDNTDLYEHTTGFDNSRAAAADYVRFIANEAHARGLKYSLKNSMDLIPRVKGVVDFYQNEQCQQYGEMDRYQGVGPVFNIEYKRPPSVYRRKGFYSLLKRQDMGAWESEL
ncbi:MAG: endo alpha-1,4 polygalactosaminidase [Phycisphaerales bacterium]|nr:endo alpha-1,4 polygalactosaminidase [Phycisphaerales bacterium]